MMTNLNHKHFITLLMCLLPAICFGQDTYDGQVINKVTEAPVPSVTVILLKERIATQTNERGYFNLTSEKPKPNDTLQFSSVGYVTFKLPVSAYEPQIFIALEPSNTQLDEVRVDNRKTETATLSKFSFYNLKNNTRFVLSRTSIAKPFTAPRTNSVLINVAIGRQEHPSSPSHALKNDLTTFLLKVYSQNPFTKKPQEVLFTKTISLTDNSKWVNVDLSKDNVVIPGNNFFIAIEWIINPYNEIISIHNVPKVSRTTKKGWQIYKDASEYDVLYQPFLISYTRFDNTAPAPVYTMSVDGSWQQYNIGYAELALSATINY